MLVLSKNLSSWWGILRIMMFNPHMYTVRNLYTVEFQCTCTVQIDNELTMLCFLESTPKRRKPGKQTKDGVEIFQVETHSSKQLRHFKYRTIRLLLSWCTSSNLLQQVCFVMVTFDSFNRCCQGNLWILQQVCCQGSCDLCNIRCFVIDL